jgi:hypothetical protein
LTQSDPDYVDAQRHPAAQHVDKPQQNRTVTTVFCWVVELAQLSGVPAELSARSLAARLALGVQFDPPHRPGLVLGGVAPLVALHHLVRARHRSAAA